jgi:lantibiotic biosynthesis protein
MIVDNDIVLHSKVLEHNKKIVEPLVTNIATTLPNIAHYLKDFTVHEGWLGVSLFYCYYAKFTDNDHYYDQAEQYLDKALANVDPQFFKKESRTDSYDNNLASLGKFFQLSVKNGFLDLDVNSFLDNIDHTMAYLMQSKIDVGDLNLFSGALASGHYFLHRDLEQPVVIESLKKILKGIESHAQQDEDGDWYWYTRSLKNQVFLGVSHGSSMIISFLAALAESGIEKEKCLYIIRRAVSFMLKQKRTINNGLFPITVGDPLEAKQFSLCYGDIGPGYGLLRAGLALNDRNIYQEAQLVLDNCCQRRYEDKRTWDASLLYGASGLAYSFDKIARLDVENAKKFSEAADYWYQQIPKYAVHNSEFAGFSSMMSKATHSHKTSFSWGIIGIGISLMKYLDPKMPNLDGFNILI